ncbi:hypothetical protein BT96DRAFT_980893 [Gymnopus androsaceus JB14]|uniref:Methyltransferase type 11 domain-containing protein n=1 Tax=Gymnopus androsaceus JB14 TaxID=1447944 RepID=A0A6A4GTX7_9AGAR|nr:hypothetical protein BT96DRAFT_980893 [Gymnopus androsaceus JB14]
MSNTPSAYALPQDYKEQGRLSQQYTWMKALCGSQSPVPDRFSLDGSPKIIDIAAGTCSWILDVANVVKNKPHVDGTQDIGEQRAHLFACDIDMSKCPPRSVMEDLRIKLFSQDVTKPFPAEMEGTFDLVHMTLLVFALTTDGWKAALENCRKLLKPGGLLMLTEVDPIIYSSHKPPPPSEAPEHDPVNAMAGPTWRHKHNSIYTGAALRNGFIVGLTHRLPKMLQAASFSVLEFDRITVPVGKLCHEYRGFRGDSLAEFENISLENTDIMLDGLSRGMLKKNILEAPLGNLISTEEEMKQVLGEIYVGTRDEGSLGIMGVFVARAE